MNRYEVLNEMAIYYDAQARMFSQSHTNLTAKPGYEIPFAEAKDKASIIRGMMKDARYGGGFMEPRQISEALQALECCRENPKRCEECPLNSQKKRRYNCIDTYKDMAASALSQLLKNRTGEVVGYPPAGKHEARPAEGETLRPWQVEQMKQDRQRESQK